VIVCHCRRVNGATVEAAILSGATTVGEVTKRSRAGERCGSCCPTIEALLRRVAEGPSRAVEAAA
jgi:assimilatory nitrate reductase electron transfer subunit